MNLADYTWHALFCPPNQELMTGHKLAPMGHPFIVPTEKKWRERAKKLTREYSAPVFPRYVFTGFRDAPNWELLRERAPTIQGYMAFGATGPATFKISDVQWLEDLRDRLAGKAQPVPFQEAVKPGDKVRVSAGPLASMIVTVDKIVSKEIHTFQQFMGGLVLVKIGLANVEPIA